MKKIINAIWHNALGESVSDDDLMNWSPGESWRPFLPVELSWTVDRGKNKMVITRGISINLLPDKSGFICVVSGFYPDNCFVLDAYGKERYLLTVPWELVSYEVPFGSKMWFRGPSTHPDGEYGVTAWIEYAGDFYFELDYHEGQFLWGKEIRF